MSNASLVGRDCGNLIDIWEPRISINHLGPMASKYREVGVMVHGGGSQHVHHVMQCVWEHYAKGFFVVTGTSRM